MRYCNAFVAVVTLLMFKRGCTTSNGWLRCSDDCTQVTCGKNKTFKTFCQAGTVYDRCGCCQVCAKAEGEFCDGINGFFGRCGRGLYCHTKSGKLIGKCKVRYDEEPSIAARSRPFIVQSPNSIEGSCKPKCTPEYCTGFPGSICSAVDNAVIERPCQFPCQHTICEACYYKPKREPPCPKCATDDFQCFRTFGKCVRKETCSRHKYPCQSHHVKRKSEGKFLCKVAACAG